MGAVFLLSAALSIDSLTVGLTYGLRKVKIPVFSLLILFACSFGVLCISVFFGQALTHIFSEKISNWIGGLILIGLGAWILFQKGKEISCDREETEALMPKTEADKRIFQIEIQSVGLVIQILKTPTLADLDGSGRITCFEALMLGLALSLDSFGAGIGMGVLGFHPVLLSVAVACMSMIFLQIGAAIGRRFSHVGWMPYITACSGMILMVMGFLRL